MSGIRPSGNSVTFTTANTVNRGTSCFISTTALTLLTFSYANAAIYGTVVIPANQTITIKKNPSDTITANVSISASPVTIIG